MRDKGFPDFQRLIPSTPGLSKLVEIVETGARGTTKVGIPERMLIFAGQESNVKDESRDFRITQLVDIPVEISQNKDGSFTEDSPSTVTQQFDKLITSFK
jgi:hypothetical protein